MAAGFACEATCGAFEKRKADADDLAGAAVFFASDESFCCFHEWEGDEAIASRLGQFFRSDRRSWGRVRPALSSRRLSEGEFKSRAVGGRGKFVKVAASRTDPGH